MKQLFLFLCESVIRYYKNQDQIKQNRHDSKYNYTENITLNKTVHAGAICFL